MKKVTVTSEKMAEMVGGLADLVTKSKGMFTVYKGYFYTHGYNEEKLANNVVAKLGADKVQVVSTKNQWKNFIGGAPIQKQSYFSVTFKYLG